MQILKFFKRHTRFIKREIQIALWTIFCTIWVVSSRMLQIEEQRKRNA